MYDVSSGPVNTVKLGTRGAGTSWTSSLSSSSSSSCPPPIPLEELSPCPMITSSVSCDILGRFFFGRKTFLTRSSFENPDSCPSSKTSVISLTLASR